MNKNKIFKNYIRRISCFVIAATMISPDIITSESTDKTVVPESSGAAESESAGTEKNDNTNKTEEPVKSADTSDTKADTVTEEKSEKKILTITSSGSLTQDEVCDGLIINSNVEYSLNGHSLTVNGDVYNSGTLTVRSDGCLNVTGNVTVQNGLIHPMGGTINIDGDLRLMNAQISEDGTVSYVGQNNWDYYYGRIIMDDADDHVNVGGTFAVCTGYESTMTKGVLEIKGDLLQFSNFSTSCFYSSGEHKVILNGSKKQIVAMNGNASTFGILELKNSSKDGIVFTTPVNCSKLIKNDSVLTLPEGQKIGWTVNEETEEYNGDLTLVSGDLDLNGKELIVHGNLIQKSGTVYLNGGKLVVEGNYELSDRSQLKMTNEKDVLTVKKDFTTSSIMSGADYLTNGTMYVGGNISQKNGAKNSICAAGAHTLVLNGTEAQTVNFEGDQSYFASLKIENTSKDGVTFGSNFYINGDLYETKSKTSGWVRLHSNAVFKDNSFNGDIVVHTQRKLENDTTIGGNLWVESDMDVNGKSLEVKGKMHLKSGTVKVGKGGILTTGDEIQIYNGTLQPSGGTVNIAKDLRLQYEEVAEDGTVKYGETANWDFYYGRLIMNDADDHVTVGGNLGINTGLVSEMTKGILEIKGDLLQYSSFNTGCFASKEDHKVILNGDKKQTVKMTGNTSTIGTLELKNTSKEGVFFDTSLTYADLITNNTVLNLPEGQKIGWTVNEETEEYDGDLTLVSGTLDLNGKKLIVHGNLIQKSGTVFLNGGELVVEGNYELSDRSQLKMANEKDILTVKKDFTTSSIMSGADYLTNGTMYVGGNISQKNGAKNSICAAGTHTLVLNGTEAQTVSFEGDQSYFGSLKIENTSNDGVTFGSNFYICGDLYETKSKTSGWVRLHSNAVLKDNSFNGDIVVHTQRKLENDTTIGGKLWVENNLDINGKALEVKGKVFIGSGILMVRKGGILTADDEVQIYNGTLQPSGGTVNIAKDLRLQYEETAEDGTVKYGETANWDFYYGRLIMNDADDHVTVGGTLGINTGYVSEMTKGILEIKGDLLQYSSFNTGCFTSDGEHKIILNGDKKQTVKMTGNTSTIGVLELKNTSKDGVEFATTVKYNKLITNDVPLTLSEGERLGWKVTEEVETIEEDVTLVGGVLDLNGKTLIIKGNLKQSAGTVKLNGGHLIVEKDYSITEKSGGTSSGRLNMTNEEDILEVKGNFETAFTYTEEDLLTEGKIYVNGNMTRLDGQEIRLKNNCTLILNGTSAQKINIKSKISNLILENKSNDGITFESGISVYGYLKNEVSKINKGYNLYLYGTTDSHIISSIAFGGNRTLTEDMTVDGDLYVNFDSTLDINGMKLNVKGNCICTGTINVNSGSLFIGSDLCIGRQIENADKTLSYSPEYYSCLLMNSDDDYVLVNKNFAMMSYSFGSDNMSAGILEIKGRVTQTIQNTFFAPSGTHKTILSGSELQRIDLLNSNCKFNILEITKDLSEGYKFNTEKPWVELIEAKQDTKAPSVPTTVKAESKTAVSIKLSWTKSTDENAVKGYDIYRDGVRIASSNTNEYTDNDLTPDTKYVYTVRAYDFVRNISSESEKYTVSTDKDTEKPTTPAEFKLVSQTADSVILSWNTSSDNYKVKCYTVYRNDKPIATTNETIYEDKELENGTYSYKVSAVDMYSNESETSEAVLADLMPPAVPSEIKAENLENSIKFTWKANTEEDFNKYIILRKSSEEKEYVQIGETTIAEFTDKNIVLAEKYDYIIKSADKKSNISAASKAISASIDKDIYPPVIVSVTPDTGNINNTNNISVNFSDNFAVSKAVIEYSESDKNKWTVLDEKELDSKDTYYSFTPDYSKIATGVYDFRFTITDAAGLKSEEVIKKYEYNSPSIKQPALSASGKGNKAVLSWNATDDETLSGYVIYRLDAGSEKYVSVSGVLAQNTFTDETAKEGIKYTYYVSAIDKYNNNIKSENVDVVLTPENDYKERPFGYVVRNGYIAVTDCDINASEIEIPESIDNIPVTEISDMAFKDSKATKITLPSTIKRIGYSAFENCAGLTSIALPKNLESVYSKAFAGCTGLKEIDFYNAKLYFSGKEDIPENDKFTLKASLSSDGQTFALNNDILFVPDDCEYLISDKTVSILSYKGKNPSVKLPSKIENLTVDEISACAFKKNTNIISVEIPDTVKKIGSYAFMNCTNLQDMYFSENTLEETGADFLYGTPYLNRIKATFTIVGGNVLYRYSGTNVNAMVPAGITVIGTDAFADCDFIKTVKIPTSVKYIMDGAFFGCSGIKEIKIPESVLKIGNNAFSECSALEKAEIPQSCKTGKNLFKNTKINTDNTSKEIAETTKASATTTKAVTTATAATTAATKASTTTTKAQATTTAVTTAATKASTTTTKAPATTTAATTAATKASTTTTKAQVTTTAATTAATKASTTTTKASVTTAKATD